MDRVPYEILYPFLVPTLKLKRKFCYSCYCMAKDRQKWSNYSEWSFWRIEGLSHRLPTTKRIVNSVWFFELLNHNNVRCCRKLLRYKFYQIPGGCNGMAYMPNYSRIMRHMRIHELSGRTTFEVDKMRNCKLWHSDISDICFSVWFNPCQTFLVKHRFLLKSLGHGESRGRFLRFCPYLSPWVSV